MAQPRTKEDRERDKAAELRLRLEPADKKSPVDPFEAIMAMLGELHAAVEDLAERVSALERK